MKRFKLFNNNFVNKNDSFSFHGINVKLSVKLIKKNFVRLLNSLCSATDKLSVNNYKPIQLHHCLLNFMHTLVNFIWFSINKLIIIYITSHAVILETQNCTNVNKCI